MKSANGSLRDHAELIADYDIDFRFVSNLYIVFGILMEILSIYQSQNSSAASVISNYERIMKVACMRRADSEDLRKMLELLAKNTLLYFGGRESLGGTKNLKSAVGDIEKTLYFGDHRNHRLSFYRMREYIEASTNISGENKKIFLKCLENLTRFAIFLKCCANI